MPTTAGTGSEVGRAGVITQEATHTKKVIFHPKMMPRMVICDPELTAGMPPSITMGTGMDALAHCFEAYCAPSYHPMAEGIAVEGTRLIFANLPKAVANGKDLEARAHMMSAAAMGATSNGPVSVDESKREKPSQHAVPSIVTVEVVRFGDK